MIKTLLGSVREYKKDSLLAPATMIGEVAMEVTIPMLMALLIDNGINAGNMGYIWRIGGLLALCCLASLACGVLSGKYAARASAGFAKNLRGDMFRNVQTFSFGNIDRFSTSSLVTRLTTDVSNVQNSYQMIIRTAVRAPMMLLFALFMAFRVHAQLSLIFLAVIPILAGGLLLIIRYAHPTFERVFKTYDKLNNVVQENVHGVRVVKSFVREDYETEKFKKISQSIYKDFSFAERLLAFNGPLMQFASYTCMLLLCWLGGQMIVREYGQVGGMTTGQLTSLLSYTMQILMSLMMLSMIFVMIVISQASIHRISEVLEEKTDLTSPEGAVKDVRDGSVEFDHVSFQYSKDADRTCLTDVNLKIASGQTIGIIGGTGSSKTTFVQMIPRLYDATEGVIRVGGRDVREYDLDALRNSVAMVLQKNELFSGTIKDNLRWGNPGASDGELKEACRLAQADEFVSAFPEGYDTHIEQGGTNVSGGQKQRLCIARALLKKPKILILDDSTSAVDTRTDALIRKAFREYIPDTTKIIIAQRIASVMDADAIIVLDGGRVVDMGTHEELLSRNEIYREVYTSQRKGGGEE